jgi:hypothetical protein
LASNIAPTVGSNETLQKRHKFEYLGASYFDFRCAVVSYPKCHLPYDDVIDTATFGWAKERDFQLSFWTILVSPLSSEGHFVSQGLVTCNPA